MQDLKRLRKNGEVVGYEYRQFMTGPDVYNDHSIEIVQVRAADCKGDSLYDDLFDKGMYLTGRRDGVIAIEHDEFERYAIDNKEGQPIFAGDKIDVDFTDGRQQGEIKDQGSHFTFNGAIVGAGEIEPENITLIKRK